MLDLPYAVTTWKITRTYHIKANDREHALRKLNKGIDQGYDSRYLFSQKVVEVKIEDVRGEKEKHPLLKEAWKQITGKK